MVYFQYCETYRANSDLQNQYYVNNGAMQKKESNKTNGFGSEFGEERSESVNLWWGQDPV